MKETIRKVGRWLKNSPFAPLLARIFTLATLLDYRLLCGRLKREGNTMPDSDEVKAVVENVTFIYKSFQRQSMAKRLYRNIQHYYPGARVIIADDSRKPLNLTGESLQVIQLPFNVGLSRGINAALAEVKTPYVMRMDDDELLTPASHIGRQLALLEQHPEIGIAAVMPSNAFRHESMMKDLNNYLQNDMGYAPLHLLLPHMQKIDEAHMVVGKPPNIWLGRTEVIRGIGYDNNIRMLDHNDFFYRAAGRTVTVLDHTTRVFHYHNVFAAEYQKFRSDVDGDRRYIHITRYMR